MPWEFWKLTPAEFLGKLTSYHRRLSEGTRKQAWAVATVINACGHLKEPVTVDELLGLKRSTRKATVTSKKCEKLFAEAEDVARRLGWQMSPLSSESEPT